MSSLPPELDDEILDRFTGQHEVRDPAEARRRLDEAAAELRQARAEARCVLWPAIWASVRLGWSCLARAQRQAVNLPSRLGLPRGIAALIGAAAAVALMAPLLMLVSPAPTAVLIVIALTMLAAGIFLVWTFTDRGADDGEALVHDRRVRWSQAWASYAQARAALLQAQQRHKAAADLHRGLLQAASSKVNQLLNTNCELMTGEEFERFLGEVFKDLGYRVEHTGRSCGPGVDLIVQKGPLRVAVQAKYSGGSVSEVAVQQVYAGMAHYGCQMCAVVSDSYFTNGAEELARSVRCRLIDGHTLRNLIRGRIRVEDPVVVA